MNKDITPIIDEIYWKIYQVYEPPYSYNFVLYETFHFNSLTCMEFLSTRSPYEQLKKTLVYIPERMIQNSTSNIFIKNKDTLIKQEVPFIKIIDGYKWTADIDMIRKYENSIL